MTTNDNITDQGKAAIQPLDQPGAPTPARIADRLGNITIALDTAVANGDLGAIVNGLAELKRLRSALTAWDAQERDVTSVSQGRSC